MKEKSEGGETPEQAINLLMPPVIILFFPKPSL